MKSAIYHDQFFKTLLQSFFQEFMELFYPTIAARLDFMRVTFLDKETFTDFPQGDQREADLIVRVHTLDGEPEIILVHIEVEAQRRSWFPKRMFEYYQMIGLRLNLPVLPIVIYLSPAGSGIITETYVERVFDRVVVVFTYDAIGLPDLLADDYLELESPLGPAMSALMTVSQFGTVVQKYHSLRAIASSYLDNARKAMLTYMIETYLVLTPVEQVQYQELISKPEAKEVREMISTYEQHGILLGKREALLRGMQLRFGVLPTAIQTRIEALSDTDQLDTMFDRIFTAKSLEEMVPDTGN